MYSRTCVIYFSILYFIYFFPESVWPEPGNQLFADVSYYLEAAAASTIE